MATPDKSEAVLPNSITGNRLQSSRHGASYRKKSSISTFSSTTRHGSSKKRSSKHSVNLDDSNSIDRKSKSGSLGQSSDSSFVLTPDSSENGALLGVNVSTITANSSPVAKGPGLQRLRSKDALLNLSIGSSQRSSLVSNISRESFPKCTDKVRLNREQHKDVSFSSLSMENSGTVSNTSGDTVLSKDNSIALNRHLRNRRSKEISLNLTRESSTVCSEITSSEENFLLSEKPILKRRNTDNLHFSSLTMEDSHDTNVSNDSIENISSTCQMKLHLKRLRLEDESMVLSLESSKDSVVSNNSTNDIPNNQKIKLLRKNHPRDKSMNISFGGSKENSIDSDAPGDSSADITLTENIKPRRKFLLRAHPRDKTLNVSFDSSKENSVASGSSAGVPLETTMTEDNSISQKKMVLRRAHPRDKTLNISLGGSQENSHESGSPGDLSLDTTLADDINQERDVLRRAYARDKTLNISLDSSKENSDASGSLAGVPLETTIAEDNSISQKKIVLSKAHPTDKTLHISFGGSQENLHEIGSPGDYSSGIPLVDDINLRRKVLNRTYTRDKTLNVSLDSSKEISLANSSHCHMPSDVTLSEENSISPKDPLFRRVHPGDQPSNESSVGSKENSLIRGSRVCARPDIPLTVDTIFNVSLDSYKKSSLINDYRGDVPLDIDMADNSLRNQNQILHMASHTDKILNIGTEEILDRPKRSSVSIASATDLQLQPPITASLNEKSNISLDRSNGNSSYSTSPGGPLFKNNQSLPTKRKRQGKSLNSSLNCSKENSPSKGKLSSTIKGIQSPRTPLSPLVQNIETINDRMFILKRKKVANLINSTELNTLRSDSSVFETVEIDPLNISEKVLTPILSDGTSTLMHGVNSVDYGKFEKRKPRLERRFGDRTLNISMEESMKTLPSSCEEENESISESSVSERRGSKPDETVQLDAKSNLNSPKIASVSGDLSSVSSSKEAKRKVPLRLREGDKTLAMSMQESAVIQESVNTSKRKSGRLSKNLRGREKDYSKEASQSNLNESAIQGDGSTTVGSIIKLSRKYKGDVCLNISRENSNSAVSQLSETKSNSSNVSIRKQMLRKVRSDQTLNIDLSKEESHENSTLSSSISPYSSVQKKCDHKTNLRKGNRKSLQKMLPVVPEGSEVNTTFLLHEPNLSMNKNSVTSSVKDLPETDYTLQFKEISSRLHLQSTKINDLSHSGFSSQETPLRAIRRTSQRGSVGKKLRAPALKINFTESASTLSEKKAIKFGRRRKGDAKLSLSLEESNEKTVSSKEDLDESTSSESSEDQSSVHDTISDTTAADSLSNDETKDVHISNHESVKSKSNHKLSKSPPNSFLGVPDPITSPSKSIKGGELEMIGFANAHNLEKLNNTITPQENIPTQELDDSIQPAAVAASEYSPVERSSSESPEQVSIVIDSPQHEEHNEFSVENDNFASYSSTGDFSFDSPNPRMTVTNISCSDVSNKSFKALTPSSYKLIEERSEKPRVHLSFQRRKKSDHFFSSFSMAESERSQPLSESLLPEKSSSEEKETKDETESEEETSKAESLVESEASSVDKSQEKEDLSERDEPQENRSEEEETKERTESEEEASKVESLVESEASSADKSEEKKDISERDEPQENRSEEEEEHFSVFHENTLLLTQGDQTGEIAEETCIEVLRQPDNSAQSSETSDEYWKRKIEEIKCRVKAQFNAQLNLKNDILERASIKKQPKKAFNNPAKPKIKRLPIKLYKPAVWATKGLYNFLTSKLQPEYGLDSVNKAQNLVKLIFSTYNVVIKSKNYEKLSVDKLKRQLAEAKIIVTTFDFYNFVREFLPFEFEKNVIPCIQPFTNIVWPPKDSSLNAWEPILKINSD